MIGMTWIPRQALGPYVLGTTLQDSLARPFKVFDTPVDDVVRLKSYVSEDGTRLEVRDTKIESVTSEVEFIYQERNLIGMSLAAIEDLIGIMADEIDKIDPADEDLTIADFTKVGLQLTIRNERVVSATCY